MFHIDLVKNKFPKRAKTHNLQKNKWKKKKKISNTYSPIGKNQLIGLMIWDWRRKFSEVSMVMASTNPPPSKWKASCPLFRATTPLPRRNQEQVKQVLSLFPLCSVLIQLQATFKLWSSHQQESFLSKLHSLSTPSENSKESIFMHALVVLSSERTSRNWRLVAFKSLLELQVEFSIWWRKVSSRPTTFVCSFSTRQMRCSTLDSSNKSKISSSSYQETSRSLFSQLPCQPKSWV